MNLVSEDINTYCWQHSTTPSRVCEDLQAHTKANVPMATMVTGPLEASLLGLFIGLLRAKRVLEIGTFTGYSALAMAERLPAGGEVITLDVNPETTKLAKSFWQRSPHGHKIQAITGPALETITKLKGPFDLVFIDADKGNYLKYFLAALELISVNGLIAVDNTLWSGKVLESNPSDADTKAIQELNNYVKAHPTLEASLLPVRDGLLLVRRKSIP